MSSIHSVQEGPGPSPQPHGHLSLRDLCCLFCCPPCPSNIVSKLAFMPPEPTYKLIPNEAGSQHTLELVEGKSEWPYGEGELEEVEVFYAPSSRGNRIACIHIPCCGRQAKYTILFSHGNAVDLGQMSSFYYGLGLRLGCNVFSYDYSGMERVREAVGKESLRGYLGGVGGIAKSGGCVAGVSNIVRTEHRDSTDNRSGRQVRRRRRRPPFPPHVRNARRLPRHPADMVFRRLSQLRWQSNLTRGITGIVSASRKSQSRVPTLVIHGTEDEVIDFSHGLSIYERCPKAVEPLWVPGAGHNDVELHSAYLERLKQFIEEEAGKGASGTVPRAPESGIAPRVA